VGGGQEGVLVLLRQFERENLLVLANGLDELLIAFFQSGGVLQHGGFPCDGWQPENG
jgi:hypothetical protein